MRKNVIIPIIAFAMMTMVACGGSGNTGTNSQTSDNGQTTENSQTTKNEGAQPSNSNMVIIDGMKPVEESIGVEFAKMFPNAFAVDGAIMSKKYTIYFVHKDKRNANESNSEIEAFNKYLKSVAADGKLYSNQELSNEFDGTIEDGVFERLCVKIGEKKWNVTVSYGETNYEYADGKQYPYYCVWFERITE